VVPVSLLAYPLAVALGKLVGVGWRGGVAGGPVFPVSLIAYPLAAMGGALCGSICHEATHAVAAVALGELVGVGWRGGVAGGPFVDFRADARWRSEVIRKAPLALGVIALAATVVTYHGPTLAWVALAAASLAVVWSSPEDFSRERAEAAAAD